MGNCRSSETAAGSYHHHQVIGATAATTTTTTTTPSSNGASAVHKKKKNNNKKQKPAAVMSLATVTTEATVEDSSVALTTGAPPEPEEKGSTSTSSSSSGSSRNDDPEAPRAAAAAATTTTEAAAPMVVMPAMDEDGNTNLGAEMDRNTMEEMDYEGPTSLQEEINEMMEAVYAVLSEEQIQSWQRHLDSIQKQQIAEGAAKALSPAPDFSLVDQDGERVSLSKLCRKGPVVMQFYRGKWCPHCNAGLMAYNQFLHEIEAHGATFVAISPMLPDGSQFLASKRDLNFAVLSDCGNTVARTYNVTFCIPEDIRPLYLGFGADVGLANGSADLWEVPLVATYVINQKQQIVWSFVDNNHGNWAEPAEVVRALELYCGPNANQALANINNNNNNSAADKNAPDPTNNSSQTRGWGIERAFKTTRETFGPDQKPPAEHFGQYLLPPES